MHEAHVEQTKQGRLPTGEGWFILNLGEMPWETVPGFGVWRGFDWAIKSGEPGIGVHIHVLRPGENFGYYHAEAAQERVHRAQWRVSGRRGRARAPDAPVGLPPLTARHGSRHSRG